MKSFFLYPGHAYVTNEPTTISTVLGSCVAVALFCPDKKIGGLNHFLLPRPLEENDSSLKYGCNAIHFLLNKLREELKGETCKIEAKFYGGGNIIGANIFKESVGELNIEMAFMELEKLKIPVIDFNVGGNLSRRIKFITNTFEVFHEFVG
ncbi:chemotaxis protein CheD [Fluviispira sanaruensis]|uniref:Probable chemoreceptor glutamine deamidase CheD n=1 Tax=Fluviispira sanaruensis TaxID=2493639 RepID=A0A4P2VN38_FLUSA|nr:chemotaxis protein CheD [Fluviispira sanaruensis]BBH52959.1 hypothetical protein JCM31447_14020 [Fluviispira sanaruensis]